MSRRIEFTAHGGPEVLSLVSRPVPDPGDGEVRVRNHAVGLNFIDTYQRSGLYPVAHLPSGLGSEGAGVVEAVGPGVTTFQPGDRIAYGTGPLGAYAEHHVLPAAHLVRLPDAIGFEQAAAIMLKGLTVQYLFRQTHVLQAGDTVLFHAAAGGVGLLACQWAKALGVRLIGTAGGPDKVARALAAGAWAGIDYDREDVVARVLELTEGRKCPVVYDGVGAATWATSLDCVAPRGLLVSFGKASGPVTGVNLGILAQKGSLYVTRPTLGSYANTPERLQAMADELFGLVQRGAITVEIGQRFALADAAEAHRALAGRRTVGATVLLP